MSEDREHEAIVQENIDSLGKDRELHADSIKWIRDTSRHRYSYNFSWLGRPIIQYPQDIVAMQEIIWDLRPELIVETGIAHGGSLIFYASMLYLAGIDGQVLGIDVDIRPHNRRAIESHPMSGKITMLEGSSTDESIIAKVKDIASACKSVLVVLDSNHTHDHVLRELELYSPFVSKDSYLVVFDTVVDDMPADFFPDRPWGKGNNPKTAVHEFLGQNDRFEIDRRIQDKLLITVAPEGYLKCIRD